MKSESIKSLTASPSEKTFTILDLQALSQRAEASAEANDNARRISLAASALLHFAEQTWIGESTEPAETAVTYLLTDLMLLCTHFWPDDGEVSFDSLMKRAKAYFEAESNERSEWECSK